MVYYKPCMYQCQSHRYSVTFLDLLDLISFISGESLCAFANQEITPLEESGRQWLRRSITWTSCLGLES